MNLCQKCPLFYKYKKYDFRGNYDIIIGTNSVGKYEGTGSFGELALMYNTPRAATIKAITNGTLWSLVSQFPFAK